MTTESQRRRRDAAYRRGFEDGRAERLAGARMVTDAMVKAFIRRSSRGSGDTEACVRAGLSAALAEPAGEVGPTREMIEGGLIDGSDDCECGETTLEDCNDCCLPHVEPAGEAEPVVLDPLACTNEAGDFLTLEEAVRDLLAAFRADYRTIGYRSDLWAALEECLIVRATQPDASSTRDAETAAARDVLAERRRQVEAEGWTLEHDDKDHDSGDLGAAGSAYALHAADMLNPYSQGDGRDLIPDFWPFSKKWWKPSDPRRNLVKAGALILAEIERIDRTESKP